MSAAGGAGGDVMNPLALGMMMGGMGMGMPPFGMMPGMAMGPGGMAMMSGEKAGKKKKKRKKSSEASSSSDSDSSDAAPAQAERRRGRSRGRSRSRSRSRRKEREPVRIAEVEQFLEENQINAEVTRKVRLMSPDKQRRLIERQLTGDVQNPSKVILARVREMMFKTQDDQPSGPSPWGMMSAMMGASNHAAVAKYIEDFKLDELASRQLRALAPQQQAIALSWDLSKYRNASSKFMAKATELSTLPPMQFPGVMPMPGMPSMPGMPGMPGMPMMPMGPMGHFPPPGPGGRW